MLCKYVIEDLYGEEIIGMFHEKVLQKVNQIEFRVEKVLRKKMINYVSDGKNKIQVELVLSNYATKSDLKMQQMLIHQILLKRMLELT